MARWNNSDRARIDYRRRQVARLDLRGLDLREIGDALEKGGIINPQTGEPYDLSTISRDLTCLREQWQKEAQADIAEQKGRQLAELREARRRAWQDTDVAEVRHSIETEMKLLGTAAASHVDVTTGGEAITIREIVVERTEPKDIREPQTSARARLSSAEASVEPSNDEPVED